VLLLDYRSKLGKFKGAGAKPPPHFSIASRPGLLKQQASLSTRCV